MDIPATKAVRIEELAFDGFLIDMDGTLIDTTAAITRHWADMDVLKIVAPEFATWDSLVLAWHKILRLPLPEPELLITAESVQNGKPDPACYNLGREILRLNNKAPDILVVEDSPAGIRAGKAANCWVVGLLTSHSKEQIAAAGPDWIIQDLTSVKVLKKHEGKVIIELHSRA
ncbi:2-deoxyglucose-6-phosphate phosphatase 1 [Colletotrichum liriopes]|uniref:2-deoxyglucose-6-phosphate phosphatase 1 n=1 Tax=Colletotrichum liriopes TaxID=708192 RepID=A0AA37GMQ2_9PEZI|nr:2-deoxyglucose-6-phosphate phosphatase 1 [Colletotrichum liriopes]